MITQGSNRLNKNHLEDEAQDRVGLSTSNPKKLLLPMPPFNSIKLARFGYQHNRDPVSDGIGQMRRFRDQFLRLGIVAERRSRLRTYKRFEHSPIIFRGVH